jgi:hypothetical protein
MGVLDQEGYDRIIACIQGEMDAGRPVYVHCWAARAARAPWSDACSSTVGWITTVRSNGSPSYARALARRVNPVRSRRRSTASLRERAARMGHE